LNSALGSHHTLLDRPRSTASRISRSLCKLRRIRREEAGQPILGRALSLVGGSGTSLSSGTTFTDGSPANYFVHGTINETTANNGQAVLDTANGDLITQPDPFIPKIKIDEAFLQMHLPTAQTFSAVGLFDFAVPATILGTYDVALTNDSPGSPGWSLQMRVRETNTGHLAVSLCG
jgi:hypothetical protein